MLVLTRKVGESIDVPDSGISITVLEVRGERIRLGISGPPAVRVYRREVWKRIQGEPGGESLGPPKRDRDLEVSSAPTGTVDV